jgi:hypothetical protein
VIDSDKQRPLTFVGNIAVPDSRPDAAHVATGLARFRFRPLDPEERATYRKWRRSALIFYGACALVLAGAAATRNVPVTPSNLASESGAHSTVAVASKQHVLD